MYLCRMRKWSFLYLFSIAYILNVQCFSQNLVVCDEPRDSPSCLILFSCLDLETNYPINNAKLSVQLYSFYNNYDNKTYYVTTDSLGHAYMLINNDVLIPDSGHVSFAHKNYLKKELNIHLDNKENLIVYEFPSSSWRLMPDEAIDLYRKNLMRVQKKDGLVNNMGIECWIPIKTYEFTLISKYVHRQ